jgi:hypothetical protein
MEDRGYPFEESYIIDTLYLCCFFQGKMSPLSIYIVQWISQWTAPIPRFRPLPTTPLRKSSTDSRQTSKYRCPTIDPSTPKFWTKSGVWCLPKRPHNPVSPRIPSVVVRGYGFAIFLDALHRPNVVRVKERNKFIQHYYIYLSPECRIITIKQCF